MLCWIQSSSATTRFSGWFSFNVQLERLYQQKGLNWTVGFLNPLCHWQTSTTTTTTETKRFIVQFERIFFVESAAVNRPIDWQFRVVVVAVIAIYVLMIETEMSTLPGHIKWQKCRHNDFGDTYAFIEDLTEDWGVKMTCLCRRIFCLNLEW